MQQRDDETASPRVELNKSLRRNIYNVITIESPGDTDFVQLKTFDLKASIKN